VTQAAHARDEHHGRRAVPRQVDRVMSGTTDGPLGGVREPLVSARRFFVFFSTSRGESRGSTS
jgi:hypothetical protein